MSSYIRNTKNPNTGKFEPAFWVDDMLGHHHYGVVLEDGTVLDPDKVELETNDKVTDLTWKDYPMPKPTKLRGNK